LEDRQPPTETGVSGGGDWGAARGGEIMSNLPHRRPHRRTGRRKSHAPALEGAAARAAADADPRRSSPLRPPRRTRAARGGGEGAPGLPELALSATVEAAKIPLGVTASVARRAAGLVGRRAGS
jgi:hypothetical protein